jgi:hypothetical protein
MRSKRADLYRLFHGRGEDEEEGRGYGAGFGGAWRGGEGGVLIGRKSQLFRGISIHINGYTSIKLINKI